MDINCLRLARNEGEGRNGAEKREENAGDELVERRTDRYWLLVVGYWGD